MEQAESRKEQEYVCQLQTKGSVSSMPQHKVTALPIKSRSATTTINYPSWQRYIMLLNPFSVIYLHHVHPMTNLLYLYHFLQTAAHEIGHVLGMDHDFDTAKYRQAKRNGERKQFYYRKYNGKSCAGGFMSYQNMGKNGWSACSARDMSRMLTKGGKTKPCTFGGSKKKSSRFK